MRRVVFAALLIRPRPRLSALGRGEPIVSVGRAHRAPAARRPVDMYRSSRWGAPRLRAAALSSLPACAPSPLAGRNLPPSFHAPAARPRPCALTLSPPGFVLPLVALAPPRFSSERASLIPALSLPCGARYARPYANACPLPCGLRYAPPTPRKPACGEYEKASWCMMFPLAAGANHAECPFLSFYALRHLRVSGRPDAGILCRKKDARASFVV